jgi:serine phosphatase RsbU (regulator of sigma subunit)/putative methionine-R-sulfoxide reductase with GAF domain
MSLTTKDPIALWRQFLALVEKLLSQPNTQSIERVLVSQVSQQFSCRANLYYVEPAYPLPGERPVSTLPRASCSELVYLAYSKKKIQVNSHPNAAQLPFETAIPLITHDTLLAILEVTRPPEKPFTHQEIELLEGICAYAAVSMQVSRQVTLKNWRYEQISLVRSVSAQIANVMDLDQLCSRVTKLIQTSFNYYSVAIFTLEKGKNEPNELRFRAVATETLLKPIHELSAKIGEGMIGYTAQTGKERVAKNVKDDIFFKEIDTLPETKAEATLPLMVEGRILGVLDVQSRKIESFHESDMMVLRALADNIALAVEGTHLYDNLQKRADQLKAVLEINYALTSVLDLDSLLEEIVQRIHERFNYPFVHILTVHPGRHKVIYQTGSGMRFQHLHSNSFAYDLDAPQGMIPLVARTGKPILANDVELEPSYLPSKLPPHNTQSELTIPLIFGKDVLGVLDLQSDQKNSFDEDDLQLFEGLAAGIAVALRNATLFRSEKWRRQVADSFQDVAGLLSSNIELSDLLDRILVELEKTLPCNASAIWLIDESSEAEQTLRLGAVHGNTQAKLSRLMEENPAVREFLTKSLTQTQPSIRTKTDPYGPLGLACNMQSNYSSIAVPLRAGDKILGALTLAHHLEGRYGSESAAICSTFANYAAVAIQNARLFQSAQEEAWSSTVLLQVSEATQSISDEDELLTTMSRLIPLLVGIDQCALYLFDPNTSLFTMKSWYGFHPEEKETTISELDSLPFLKLVTAQEPISLENPAEEIGLSSLPVDENEKSVVLIPISAHNETLGAMLVSHKNPAEKKFDNRFREHTLAILQSISQQTAVTIENIRLVETRQEEAYITAVLLQVAQAVVSQNNLQDILDSIIHLMPILVGIETCAIYLWNKEEQRFSPSQAISTNHEVREWLKSHPFTLGEFALLDEVQQTSRSSVGMLDSAEVPPEKWTSVQNLLTQNAPTNLLEASRYWLLGFPLQIKSEFYGVLLTCENESPSRFPQKRIELLNGVAQQISLAIQDDRLKQEMIGRERMEQEIELAQQIQKTFLPEKLPRIKGWDLDLRWNTAREMGGDFYDLFAVHNHKYAFTIADVSDKGIPAALYMTVTRTLLHSSAMTLESSARVLKQVNHQLMLDTQNGMFITAVFGFLEPTTGNLEYSIAGHNLPLIFRGDSQTIERLNKDGMALGVLDNTPYHNQTITLNPGDAILLYTDGVTETFSLEGEIFGEERLTELFHETCIHHPEDILETLYEAVKEFRGNNILSDDLTMLLFCRKK